MFALILSLAALCSS